MHAGDKTNDSDNSQEITDMAAYQNMENSVYYGVTLALYSLIIVISCFTNNVTTVFGFISAFSTSFNVYTVPGLLYILAERKYGGSNPDKFRVIMSWFYIFLGTVFFVLELVSSSI